MEAGLATAMVLARRAPSEGLWLASPLGTGRRRAGQQGPEALPADRPRPPLHLRGGAAARRDALLREEPVSLAHVREEVAHVHAHHELGDEQSRVEAEALLRLRLLVRRVEKLGERLMPPRSGEVR